MIISVNQNAKAFEFSLLNLGDTFYSVEDIEIYNDPDKVPLYIKAVYHGKCCAVNLKTGVVSDRINDNDGVIPVSAYTITPYVPNRRESEV